MELKSSEHYRRVDRTSDKATLNITRYEKGEPRK
jgi:hypothetical protein